MEVNNISNGSIVFKLSGKDYQVKRLNLMELFGEFEADVKKQYMDNIAGQAQRITDIKERVQLQREAIKDIPKGKDLEEQVRIAMDSFEGGVKLLWLSLSKCNKITIEEVKTLLTEPDNQASITNIMSFITGSDTDTKELNVIPTGATVIETEKKTPTLVIK